MKKLKVFIILLLFITATQAQDEKEQTSYSHKGYYNSTNFGLLVGSSNNENKAPFSFMMINGYGITDQFAVGLGIGSEFMNESYLPLVIDARFYLRKQKFSPFIFMQGGYSVALDKETNDYHFFYSYLSSSSYWPGNYTLKPKGGLIINPGLGIKAMLNNNFGLAFSIGYRYQRLNYDNMNADYDKALEINMNRLEIKAGIFFK